MRKRGLISVLILSLLLSSTIPHKIQAVTEQAKTAKTSDNYVEGEAIVTLNASSETGLAKEGTASFDSDIEVENSWDFGPAKKKKGKNLYLSEVHSDTYSTKELIEKLKKQDNVVAAEPNYYRYKLATTNDTYADEQWYLDGTGAYQTTSSGIQYKNRIQTSNDSDTIVAVVDTGIDYTHEDLTAHMWKNPYDQLELPGTYGYDFGDYDSDPMDEDEDGHGTHCAGVISAVSDNNKGICGISNAKLMALKVFNSAGTSYDSAIIAAFNYIYKAQTLGANIAAINCSWGGGGSSSTSMKTLINQIGQNGSLFLFAAGNDGEDHNNAISDGCPYDLDSPYVVTVGASTQTDKKASFSDYGNKTVHLFAPGRNIFSTINSGVFYPSVYTDSMRSSRCSYFTSFDSNDAVLYHPSEIGKLDGSILYNEKSFSAEDSHNQAGSGSYCISIDAARSSATLALYMDINEMNLANGMYQVSYDMGIEENGEISWSHYYKNEFIKQNNNTYAKIISLTGNFTSVHKIYFDNIGISKANPTNALYIKYNSMSGTSMAAPQVSAATALLAAAYPNDSAVQRRNRLLNCVREVSGLSSYCMTGGILDLSKISSASSGLPACLQTTTQTNTTAAQSTSSTKKTTKLVTKITLNKKKAKLRYKKKLKLKATVKPKNATNKKVKWYVSNKKYAKVTQKGVVRAKKKGIGHTVKVYAKAKDKSKKKAYCKVRIYK